MNHSQTRFAQALLDPAQACPGGLYAWNGSDPAERFGIYRNNVVVSLVDALAQTFPVVQELVGEAFFRAMARLFVQAQPPRTRVMVWYGADFAAFVESFEPAASVPYLADVARLEMCRVRAYHAADAAAVAPEALQAALADPQQLAQLQLQLHPSLQVVASQFAIVSLWAAHQGLLQVADVDPALPQTALVFRRGLEVDTLEISAAAGGFMAALQQGSSLLAAAGADSTLDLPAILALLIRQQLITRIHTGELPHGYHHP
ncbi:MAG: DNA-binding domain-containing protein [Rhodoferax sp.]|uniref:DNA-binding domain-containing protein n=1 Tax=Rhodoferax sp. TaxID=50421 RepID=UPI0032650D30